MAVFEIAKTGSFLRFIPKGFSTERAHLREKSDKEDVEFRNNVWTLHKQGMSHRKIAERLEVSESKAFRTLDKLKKEKENASPASSVSLASG